MRLPEIAWLIQLDIVQLEEDSRKEEQAIMRETGLISKQFRVGELRVRQILLGDPRSPETAKAAPTWARSASTVLFSPETSQAVPCERFQR